MISYKLDHEAVCSNKQRSKGYFIDLLFQVILLLCFGAASFKITQTTPNYNSKVNELNNTVNEIGQLGIDSKLLKKDKDGNFVDTDAMFKEYAYSHLLLSFDLNEGEYNSKGIYDLHNDPMIKDKYISMTPDNDSLEYFYVSYLPGLPDDSGKPSYGELTPREYFINKLKRNQFAENIYDLALEHPTFKVDSGVAIYNILIKNSQEQSDKNVYDNVNDIYSSTYSISIEYFHSLKSYTTLYNQYSSYYVDLTIMFSIGYIIDFVLSCAIIYLLLPLFLKSRTLGNKFSHTVFCNNKDEKAGIKFISIRFILSLLINFYTIALVMILFSGPATISLPLVGGKVAIILFVALSLLIGIINYIFTYKCSQSIAEKISKTYQLDTELLKTENK